MTAMHVQWEGGREEKKWEREGRSVGLPPRKKYGYGRTPCSSLVIYFIVLVCNNVFVCALVYIKTAFSAK